MATVNAVLYTSKKYKDDKYPVMIRVSHRGQRSYFKIGDDAFNVKEKQWDKKAKQLKSDKRLNSNYVKQNAYIWERVNRTKEVIEGFEKQNIAWTFNLLRAELTESPSYTNFHNYTAKYIERMKKRNQHGSAWIYNAMERSLIAMLGGDEKKYYKLEIADINFDFIEKVIDYGREEVIKKNQVRSRWADGFIKLRLGQIKAILNAAIKDGEGSPHTYPFSDKYGAKKYIRTNDFRTKKRNKYVPSQFMEKFIEYKPYLHNRMMYVKHHIFHSLLPEIGYKKALTIKRQSLKTKMIDGKKCKVLELTEKEHGLEQIVPITDQMQLILDWFEKWTVCKDDYLFPIVQLVDSKEFEMYLYDRMKRKCTIVWEMTSRDRFPSCNADTFDQWNNHEVLVDAHVWTQKMFLFSYYAQGINFRDMAHLKKSDIQNNYDPDFGEYKFITFSRRKTKAPIEIQISDKLQEIIDWFEENMPPLGDYLLPIVNDLSLKGEDLYLHIKKKNASMNLHLKTIAEKCGFPGELKDLHAYFARHTYASTLRKKGAPVEVISEALGHQDLETTKVYLDTFGHKEINKFNKML